MTNKIRDGFNRLSNNIVDIEKTRITKHSEFTGSYISINEEMFLKWKVKAKSLLEMVCGRDSEHYKAFEKAAEFQGYDSSNDVLLRLKSVFEASMEDFNDGMLTSYRNLIQADVFDSELEQAKELLSTKYRLAAAVISGVVLETSLRDLCVQRDLPIGKLDKMNSDLAKSGLYNKLQQKRITALADIRNSAAHGKIDDFTESDTENMIRDIEFFLSTYLV